MSVFYHNDDPLLHNTMFQSAMVNNQANPSNLSDAYAQMYKQQLMMEMQQQQQQMAKDWVGDLDKAMKELNASTVELLNNDVEFSSLNIQLQALVQKELMNLVKLKINTNNGAVDNIKRQMDIMRATSQKVKDEEKQNYNDLNDYLKNYSHLTFDEYRRLKSGVVNNEENNNTETEVVAASTANNKKAKKN